MKKAKRSDINHVCFLWFCSVAVRLLSERVTGEDLGMLMFPYMSSRRLNDFLELRGKLYFQN